MPVIILNGFKRALINHRLIVFKARPLLALKGLHSDRPKFNAVDGLPGPGFKFCQLKVSLLGILFDDARQRENTTKSFVVNGVPEVP